MPASFSAATVAVRAPATSANLGPGYDSFGLALSRYDQVRARVSSAGLDVRVSGAGAGELALDEAHLVVRAMRAAFDRLGGQPPGLALDCRNDIPHGRGMGSSAAAIVTGIELARGLSADGRQRLSDSAALALATELEGHPDNVAACLLGGLSIAWLASGTGHAAQAATADQLTATGISPVLFIPAEQSATKAARAVLPELIAHADAAFNAGRAGLLVVALTGRPELLLAGTEDRLHQQHRAASMPASAGLISRLRGRGIAAVLSGAGSSVLALATAGQAGPAAELTPPGWECAGLTFSAGARTAVLSDAPGAGQRASAGGEPPSVTE
jgi:homoserine kinase